MGWRGKGMYAFSANLEGGGGGGAGVGQGLGGRGVGEVLRRGEVIGCLRKGGGSVYRGVGGGGGVSGRVDLDRSGRDGGVVLEGWYVVVGRRWWS